MKNKIIFTIVFTAVILAGVTSMVFLVKKGNLVNNTADIGTGLVSEIQPEENTETPVEPEKEIPLYTTIDTDYFVLILPSNWETASEENTLPIKIVDSKEEVLNEKAKEINFQTNVSINSANLEENSLKTYVELVKASLINTIPIIDIIKEEQTTVGGKEAYFMEIKSVQDDLEFGTFVALISGKENTVWAFSGNTLQESWLEYKDVFYRLIENLEIK